MDGLENTSAWLVTCRTQADWIFMESLWHTLLIGQLCHKHQLGGYKTHANWMVVQNMLQVILV